MLPLPLSFPFLFVVLEIELGVAHAKYSVYCWFNFMSIKFWFFERSRGIPLSRKTHSFPNKIEAFPLSQARIKCQQQSCTWLLIIRYFSQTWRHLWEDPLALASSWKAMPLLLVYGSEFLNLKEQPRECVYSQRLPTCVCLFLSFYLWVVYWSTNIHQF